MTLFVQENNNVKINFSSKDCLLNKLWMIGSHNDLHVIDFINYENYNGIILTDSDNLFFSVPEMNYIIC